MPARQQESDNPQNRGKLAAILERLGCDESTFLVLLAVGIGALTGVGSVLFMMLVHWVHDLSFGPGEEAGLYGGRLPMLFLLPAVGAALVGVITWYVAREAKGHGVPEVMKAIANRNGVIKLRVAIAKAVASALTIGSGGSAGTEGPIVQIGAAIGSSLGQRFRVVRHNMAVVVGCGAAAGISAVFNAPIAGVLFSMEVFLRDVSFKTFSPVLIASVISSVTASAMLGGNDAIFPIISPEIYTFHWYELGNYIALGLLCAIAGIAFIRALYATEDLFEKIKLHHIMKPVVGAAALGILGVVMVLGLGDTRLEEPAIYGNGYAFIARCIAADGPAGIRELNLTITALAIILVLKIAATCCTLGSGGSGGIFAPSLFLGAAVGYATGMIFEQTGIYPDISPPTYALVGMASVVAATTHAPMTAIVIIFEMTRNYHIILPVMFSATIATGLAQMMFRDSIYTLKLRRIGIDFDSRPHRALLQRLDVSMVMDTRFATVRDDRPLNEVIDQALQTELSDFIVVDADGKYMGMLSARDLRAVLLHPESIQILVAGELADPSVPVVQPEDPLDVVLDRFSAIAADVMPVQDPLKDGKFVGTLSRAALMKKHQQAMSGETDQTSAATDKSA